MSRLIVIFQDRSLTPQQKKELLGELASRGLVLNPEQPLEKLGMLTGNGPVGLAAHYGHHPQVTIEVDAQQGLL